MAPTIRVTPDLAAYAMVLEHYRSVPDETLATVTCTDANGTRLVRLRAGEDFTTGVVTLTDAEAALVGPVTYTFTDVVGRATSVASTFGTEVRRNHCTNPSFEIDTAGWGPPARATIASSPSSYPAAGARVAVLTSTDATAPGYVGTTAGPTVTAGQTVTGAASVSTPLAGIAFRVWWQFYGSGGAFVSATNTTAPTTVVTANTPTRLVHTTTVPAGATSARLYIGPTVAFAVGGTWRLDAVTMEVGATSGSYFDGDTPDTSSTSYEWLTATAAHASASVVRSSLAGIAGPRVHDVQLPGEVALPEFVLGLDAGRGSATVVHWPVDRSDPVVLTRPARTRTGTLTLAALSYAAARDLDATVRPGRFLMLRQSDHAGLDLYLTVSDTRLEARDRFETGWSWALVASYVEVLAPPVTLLGAAGWSFADVLAGYGSFTAVRDAHPTFAALTVGPVSS